MKKRILPFIIALSALSVSISAAFYSVFGLSKLFAGASLEVIIMAGALEAAKLVVASLLYQYWGVINKLLRAYLVSAVFILMIITSGGIYGFLSGAFEETNTQSEFLDRQVTILESKKTIFEEKKEDLTLEKTAVVKSISDLRISLSNPTSVSYYSEEAGQVITTTSSSTRRALQKELNTTISERNNISQQINATTDSIAAYDIKILDQQIGNESARELGPLKYMAELTGKSMGQIVNWFMLLIIFVFDPLAIAMVIAANMAFAQIKGVARDPKDYEVYKEKELTPEEEFEVKKKAYIESEGDLSGAREFSSDYNNDFDEDYDDIEDEEIEDDIIVTPEQEEQIKLENDLDDEGGRLDGSDEQLLQGNMVKDLPKEEKPTSTYNSPWGSAGNEKNIKNQ